MSNREQRDPYLVLGVGRRASPDEIARAYRRAARATHPDSGAPGTGSDRFQAVSDAYEVLRDPGRRAGYDRLNPLPRPAAAGGTSGSVRYAAPGSQHLVLGARPESATVRQSLRVGDPGEPFSLHRLGGIEEFIRVALALLRGGR
jgi:curved DNA-binding protein CbpA